MFKKYDSKYKTKRMMNLYQLGNDENISLKYYMFICNVLCGLVFLRSYKMLGMCASPWPSLDHSWIQDGKLTCSCKKQVQQGIPR